MALRKAFFKRGTTAEWEELDPILEDGEVGYERTGTAVYAKMGSGARWSATPYITSPAPSVTLPLTITGTPPTTGVTGAVYTFTPTAAGGTLPYTFSVASGTLPAGLSPINPATGTITGTLTTASASAGIVIRVTDAAGVVANLPAFTITVTASGGGPVAPVFTVQPSAQTVTAGATATFSVTVTGTAPIALQVQRNGVDIAGATSASYTTPATTVSGGAANNGDSFTWRASNAGGTVTSSAAVLTVTAAAVGPSPVTGVTLNSATDTTLSLSWTAPSTGTAPLTYTVAYRLGSSTGAYTTAATGVSGTSYTITGLAASTVYDVSVTATNIVNTGAAGLLNDVSTAAPAADTRPRFGYAPALLAGNTSGLQALLAAMVPMGGSAQGGRSGTFDTVGSTTNFTWFALLTSAAGASVRVYDGLGYGGFSGAGAAGLGDGEEIDPTTIHLTVADGAGNSWNLYRSDGKAVTYSTFTLS